MNARLPVTLLSDLYPRDGLSNLPFPLSMFLYYNYKLQDTDNTSRSNMVPNNRGPTSRYPPVPIIWVVWRVKESCNPMLAFLITLTLV